MNKAFPKVVLLLLGLLAIGEGASSGFVAFELPDRGTGVPSMDPSIPDHSQIALDIDPADVQAGSKRSISFTNMSYIDSPRPVNNGSSRIAMGSNAASGLMPFVAYLEIDAPDGTFACGASLIRSTVLLTAAHCFFDDYGNLNAQRAYAIIGDRRLSSTSKWYDILEVYRPSGYAPARTNTLYGDIVVAKISPKSSKKRIALANSKTSAPKWYIAAGYGKTEKSSSSNILKYVAIPSMSISKLNSWEYASGVNHILEKDHLVAGLGSNGADSCVGDSGGPLFKPGKKYTNSESRSDILMGIVSYGLSNKCGAKGWNVGFYTSVGYWRTWIDGVIKSKKL